jgi:hypothetical protein
VARIGILIAPIPNTEVSTCVSSGRSTRMGTMVSMCEVRLSPASGCEAVARRPFSPARGNRATGGAASSCDSRQLSRYRVLREASSRGDPRSVDRECAGRNAKSSVKEVEPRQSAHSVVAERVLMDRGNSASEGSTSREAGTTGVQDHGMYTRQGTVRLRSAAPLADSPRPKPAPDEEGPTPNFAAMTPAEVRCPRSSEQASQRSPGGLSAPSEGGHGE